MVRGAVFAPISRITRQMKFAVIKRETSIVKDGLMKRLADFVLLSVLGLLVGCGGGPGGRGNGGGGGTQNASPPPGQGYTALYTFKNGEDGRHPYSGLVRDSAGNLYGTTYTGGTSDFGTVFKLDTADKYDVLHTFTGGVNGPEAAFPIAGLIRDSAGNLYGTTSYGGAYGFGTIFKLDPTSHYKVLYHFGGGENGPDGAYPGGMVRDAEGNLYGTTRVGGTSGIGTIFKLDTAGNYQVLHSFNGDFSGPDGAYPSGSLIRDAARNLYGTTIQGGTLGRGTVFKLDATGTETLLYSFAGKFFGPDDGEQPLGLIRDGAGNFYGITLYGGASNYGTVFKLDAAGKATVLYSFTGGMDGSSPGAIFLDAAGNLYGTAAGGVSGWGVIFRLNIESGVYTVLHAFTGKSDGGVPNGTLIADNAANLYGTTFGGGNLTACPPSHDQDLPSIPGCGVVFRIKLP